MPIAALPENAARAIRSSLVLNDAISVIKELVDNALDSNATNIVIEISANTLDIIQVKDNGGGIGVEDRQLLCRRGHTSKIRTFEDLTQLGGTFLGFRGEALASIAELSDNVVFTTRVDGEMVGTLLKFDSSGKLISSSSAAHGTGTTVRVANFLKSIPVRKQTALKHATKTLSSIKKLLHEYAFARPTVRFQLKVLKSGSDLKANWSFVPCKDASNLGLLASKIVGKDVAAQCKQMSVNSEDDGNSIDGLLFDKDAEVSKCGGVDSFISIDGRPMTVERGLMRELNKTYRSYISGNLSDDTTLPKKVFLLLRLRCQKGSYDINIEPAKNEVMFEDPQVISNLFEQLCKKIYGEKQTHISEPKLTMKRTINTAPNFDLLLAKKALTVAQGDRTSILQPSTRADDSLVLQRDYLPSSETSKAKEVHVSRNMGDPDEQLLLDTPVSVAGVSAVDEFDDSDEIEDITDPQVNNPFVLAKMNTRLKPRDMSALEPSISPQQTQHQKGTGSEARIVLAPRRAELLPSPSPSPERAVPYQNPGPPNRPWKTRQHRDEDEEDDLPTPVSAQQVSRPPKPTLIDEWTRSISSTSPQQRLSGPTNSSPLSVMGSGENLTADATARMNSSTGKSIAGQRPMRQPTFQTPFKRQSNVHGNSSSAEKQNSSPRMTVSINRLTSPTTNVSPQRAEDNNLPGFVRPRIESNSELDEIMDFEHRKRSAILQHRGKARQQKPKNSSSAGDEVDGLDMSPLPARPENEGPSGTNYASKFGVNEDPDTVDIPPQPNSASYTQNPHRNRFRKAVRDLEDRTTPAHVEVSMDEATAQAATDSGKADASERKAKLSPRDSRAYLIRHSDSAARETKGTKLKRAVTAKLPFEVISSEAATYPYLRIADSGEVVDHQLLQSQTKELDAIDPYVRNGGIGSVLLTRTVSVNTVQRWQEKLQRLLNMNSDIRVESVEDLESVRLTGQI